MKLKKIASLALAGIMAVSMLAGCNGNPTDPETPTDPTTPATGVSASLYNELSLTAQRNITMSNSSSLDAALKKAVDDKVSESAANSIYSGVTFENCDSKPTGSAAVVQTALVDALDAVKGIGSINNSTKAGKTTTGVVVAMVGQGISEATLLQETATGLITLLRVTRWKVRIATVKIASTPTLVLQVLWIRALLMQMGLLARLSLLL